MRISDRLRGFSKGSLCITLCYFCMGSKPKGIFFQDQHKQSHRITIGDPDQRNCCMKINICSFQTESSISFVEKIPSIKWLP